MTATTLLIILLLLVLGALGAIAWLLNKKLTELTQPKQEDNTLLEWAKESSKTTQQDIKDLQKFTQAEIKDLQKLVHDTVSTSSENMHTSLQRNTKEINDRLTKAAEVIGDLKREAGAFTEMSKSVKDLQQFLNSPKLRGNLGEHVLNGLITEVLPKQQFHIQYKFKSGNTVDAAIKTDAGILCIDSKFSMENYQKMTKMETERERELARKDFQRDVKHRIDEIASKYILPEEGTMDYAMMYVPSETVFYEVVNTNALMDYAKSKRVYIVSPTTLYATLQTILLSYEGRRVESKSREVMKMLHAIQQDYKKADATFAVLGRHVTNAYNSVSSVAGAFSQLGQKLQQTAALGKAVDEPLLEAPVVEEAVEED
ncbi:MAG TPA: DNA recombination protein RmuC [Candidatus Saccharimonadia bacterium]|nr:DNA recombination protein RmuC [Candidatus Saccharimonadia bacterium]